MGAVLRSKVPVMTVGRGALWSVNPKVLKQCRSWLNDNGYSYQIVLGKYKGQLEISFATWEDVLLEAIKTGWLCDQETVILGEQNTATLYALVNEYASTAYKSDNIADCLFRIKSGAYHTLDGAPKIDADYTYFPNHRQYVSIQWYH